MKTNSKLSIHALICLTLLLCSGITAFAQTPALRANGKIAFSVATSDNIAGHEHSGISVINPDGSGRSQLTSTQTLCPPPNRTSGCGPDQLDFNPSWSPNGQQIAFIRSVPMPGSGYASDVFVMNADGSHQRQVTQLGQAGFPTWSPDGTRLAFSGPPAAGDIFYQIYVVNADGSGLHPIGRGIEPAWSPDGSKLAFLSADGLGFYLMNPDGSGRTQLTTPPTDYPCAYGPQVDRCYSADSKPSWSPDGSKLVFIRYDNCYAGECDIWRIWTVNADGSNPAMLNGKSAYYVGVAWSPDGTKIVFSADNHLFTMGADGSDITSITDTPGMEEWPSWQPVPVVPPDVNPIDNPQFFVRQQYRDFLGREPDPDGFTFWTNQIISCGGDTRCVEERRITDSASFFLSIEFQQTGYLVYRFYKTSFSNLPNAPVPIKLNEFLPDAQKIGQDVIVRQSGWEQKLEANKQAFAAEFVQRSRFVAAYPTSMSAEQFVDALFANSGVTPSASDRRAALNEFAFAASTGDLAARARALRRVAENTTFASQEFNRAFVLMQYFGYLRRNPNDEPDGNFDGYNFWLTKLNQFNGNYIQAEMVKAFLSSIEYRHRFGP